MQSIGVLGDCGKNVCGHCHLATCYGCCQPTMVCVERRRRSVEVGVPCATLQDEPAYRLRLMEGAQRRLESRLRRLGRRFNHVTQGVNKWQEMWAHLNSRVCRIEHHLTRRVRVKDKKVRCIRTVKCQPPTPTFRPEPCRPPTCPPPKCLSLRKSRGGGGGGGGGGEGGSVALSGSGGSSTSLPRATPLHTPRAPVKSFVVSRNSNPKSRASPSVSPPGSRGAASSAASTSASRVEEVTRVSSVHSAPSATEFARRERERQRQQKERARESAGDGGGGVGIDGDSMALNRSRSASAVRICPLQAVTTAAVANVFSGPANSRHSSDQSTGEFTLQPFSTCEALFGKSPAPTCRRVRVRRRRSCSGDSGPPPAPPPSASGPRLCECPSPEPPPSPPPVQSPPAPVAAPPPPQPPTPRTSRPTLLQPAMYIPVPCPPRTPSRCAPLPHRAPPPPCVHAPQPCPTPACPRAVPSASRCVPPPPPRACPSVTRVCSGSRSRSSASSCSAPPGASRIGLWPPALLQSGAALRSPGASRCSLGGGRGSSATRPENAGVGVGVGGAAEAAVYHVTTVFDPVRKPILPDDDSEWDFDTVPLPRDYSKFWDHADRRAYEREALEERGCPVSSALGTGVDGQRLRFGRRTTSAGSARLFPSTSDTYFETSNVDPKHRPAIAPVTTALVPASRRLFSPVRRRSPPADGALDLSPPSSAPPSPTASTTETAAVSVRDAAACTDRADLRQLPARGGRGGRGVVDARDVEVSAALHAAAELGREDVVDMLLAEGAPAGECGADGRSALHRAAARGHAPLAQCLLAAGAPPDARDRHGVTALHLAALRGHLRVVEALLSARADACKCGPRARTALHCAAARGHAAVCGRLLAAGADANAQDADGLAPLALAAAGAHKDTVHLLLTHGASVSLADRHGRTPLLYASACGSLVPTPFPEGCDPAEPTVAAYSASGTNWQETALVLLRHGAHADAADRAGETPLLVAAAARNLEVVRLLHKYGASLRPPTAAAAAAAAAAATHAGQEGAEGGSGESALHRAARAGCYEVVEFLVKKGACVDAADARGETPLMGAVASGRSSIVNLLLMRGANSNAADASGETPLLRVAAAGSVNVARLLLKSGADVDAADPEGDSPLLRALRARQWDMARALVREGARVAAEGRDQDTPLALAAREGQADLLALMLAEDAHAHHLPLQRCLAEAANPEVVWALLDAAPEAVLGAAGERALRDAARDGRLEVLEALLEAGVPPAARAAKTALQFAAEHGRTACLQALLSSGVDPHTGSPPALHLAASNGHAGCVSALLQGGADPDAASANSRRTALHYAAAWGQTACARLLLEWRADPDACDKEGNAPLHLAARGGHAETVQELLALGADHNVRNTQRKTPYDMSACDEVRKVFTKYARQGWQAVRQTGERCPPKSFEMGAKEDSKLHIINSHSL